MNDLFDVISQTSPFNSDETQSFRPIPSFVETVTNLVRIWEAPSSDIRRFICQCQNSNASPSKLIVMNISKWIDFRTEEAKHDNITFSLVLLLRIASTALGDCLVDIPNIDQVREILKTLNQLGDFILLLSTRLGTPNAINAAFRFCSIAFDLSKLCNVYEGQFDEDYGILIRHLIIIPSRFSSKAVTNESHCAFQKFRESNQRFANEAFSRSIDNIHKAVSSDAQTFLFTVCRDSAVSASKDAIQGHTSSLASNKYPFLAKAEPLSVIVDSLCRLCEDNCDRKYSRHIICFDQGLSALNNILVVGKVDVCLHARTIMKVCRSAFLEAQLSADKMMFGGMEEKKFLSDVFPLFGTCLRVLSLLCEDDIVGLNCSQALIFDFGMLEIIQTMIDKNFVTNSRNSLVLPPTADCFTKHAFNLFTALCMSGVCAVENVSVLNEILALLIISLKNSKKQQLQFYQQLPAFLYPLLGGFISKLVFASTMNSVFSSIKSRALELGEVLEDLYEEPD